MGRLTVCATCERPFSLSAAAGPGSAFECSFCKERKPDTDTMGRPSDREALRMILAFCSIMEPERRAELLHRAEQYAAQSEVVAGVTHFSLLVKNKLPEA